MKWYKIIKVKNIIQKFTSLKTSMKKLRGNKLSVSLVDDWQFGGLFLFFVLFWMVRFGFSRQSFSASPWLSRT